MPVSPERLAAVVVAAMLERDAASRALGMQVEGSRPGYARVAMPVRGDMVNGHGNCHGGMVFSLADSAFAFACNSRNHLTVAADCTIAYLAAARAGDRLVAEAVEQALVGRSGVYDIHVRNQRGETVALMRGRSRRLEGQIVDAAILEEGDPHSRHA